MNELDKILEESNDQHYELLMRLDAIEARLRVAVEALEYLVENSYSVIGIVDEEEETEEKANFLKRIRNAPDTRH